jgi:hypothetical protein
MSLLVWKVTQKLVTADFQAMTSSVRVRVTLQLAAYRQLVRLGDKSLESHNQ